MATIVLTAVGSVIGGPIGAAIGAVIGRTIDQQVLFAPKGREGRRLNDLRLQTSTYGTPIPRLYGTMRVAGTVIWSTDLIETRHHSGGGKSRPSSTTYTYSASFAVALSSRPVGSIGRVWADGNLLRGAAGDFKSAIGSFRLAAGWEDQPLDPLMGAAGAAGSVPAYRGIAYALFEDLDLTDFGNRIPSMTFELVSDTGAVSVQTIAQDASGGAIVADLPVSPMVDGYVALGASVAESLGPLVDAYGLYIRSSGGALRLVQDAAVAEGAIGTDMPALSANGKPASKPRLTRDPAENTPVRLAMRYFDASRDYQAGMQTATRPGPGRREMMIDLPATLTASNAQAQAMTRLRATYTARSAMELQCGWSALALPVGAIVTVPGQAGLWRIESSNWEDMLVKLTLRRVASGSLPLHAASAGVTVSQQDILHGPTHIELAELPGLGDVAESAPIAVVAAAGISTGWRRAALYVEDPTTASLTSIGTTAPSAIMGQVTSIPSPRGGHLYDIGGALVVQMLNSAMTLSNATDVQLSQGSNLALVGDELIQFGLATPLGGGQWRLDRLLRGRRGTEAAMAAHVTGERFVLLEQLRLFSVPSIWLSPGGNIDISAIGIGDLTPVSANSAITGQAVLPLAPVHAQVRPVVGGGWRIDWVRRSRAGWRWNDGTDAPLAEEQELYRVEWSDSGGIFRTVEVAMPGHDYTAASVTADILAGHAGAVDLTIRQIGTYGAGAAAVLSITI